MHKMNFPSDLKCVKDVSRKALESLKGLPLDASTLFDIKLCLEEAFINAVKYGNKNDSRLSVDVEVHTKGNSVELVVRDQGKGFDYNNAQDPTSKDNVGKPGGRGVFLIKSLMDRVVFENNGSCLRMVKKIK